MDLNDVRSFVTLFSFVLFIGLMVWSWWPAFRDAHEAASMLPFEGDGADFAAGPRQASGNRVA